MELVLYKNNTVMYTWSFANIPPTSIQYQEPQRLNLQQGLGSSYLGTPYADRFGASLPQITLEWTTSTTPDAVPTSSQARDGYQHFFNLVTNIFRQYYTQGATDTAGEWTLHLYDYPHQQFLVVIPMVNTWTHAVPENLALASVMTFAVVGDLQSPGITPPSLTQTQLMTQPGRFVQLTAQNLYQGASAMAAYLTPNALTGMQTALWLNSQFYTTWTASDYNEWFNNSAVSPALTNSVGTFLTETLPTVIEPLFSNPTLPYSVSYANLVSAWHTASAYAAQIAAITPYPYWMGSMSQSLSDNLSELTVAPQIFNS